LVYQCLFVENRTKPSIRRLWVRWALAGRAVKVAADNLKAFRKAIHSGIPSIRLRKPGYAGLSTDGTLKIFSPTVEDDHRLNMTLRRDRSTPQVAEHLGSSAEFCVSSREPPGDFISPVRLMTQSPPSVADIPCSIG
jgi:hypothetical protein